MSGDSRRVFLRGFLSRACVRRSALGRGARVNLSDLCLQKLSLFTGPLLRLDEVRRLRRRLARIQVSRRLLPERSGGPVGGALAVT